MFRSLKVLIFIFQVYCFPLLSANFEINGNKESMQVQAFSREEVLPLLPLLHEWCAQHLLGFPYYYAPPKEQLIHPFDTVYVNEKEALTVIAKKRDEVIGIASGISLGSFYLDYSMGNVFSSQLLEQFKEKGFQPNEVLYIGYFLMAENHKENARAALEMFDQFVAAAKKWGKRQICYIQVLYDESRMKESPEPYATIIPGFRHSGVEMLNLSWPTLQPDGSMQMQSHDMAFYIIDIPIY
ncbi:MAG: hypothetical protein KF898_07235 [Parachlamydiales bacterium]|nr:hypothetical protein [Candidatus Acheromyda pituitae]